MDSFFRYLANNKESTDIICINNKGKLIFIQTKRVQLKSFTLNKNRKNKKVYKNNCKKEKRIKIKQNSRFYNNNRRKERKC